MSDLVYLYVAYTVIWLGTFAYLGYLHSKQAGLRKDLDILLEKVRRHEKSKK